MPPKLDELMIVRDEHDKPVITRTSVKQFERIDDITLANSIAFNHYHNQLTRFHASSRRASQLLSLMDRMHGVSTASWTVKACKSSIISGFPLMLRQTAMLLDGLNNQNDVTEQMIAEIQSSLALDVTEHYLSNIDRTLSANNMEAVDSILRTLVDALHEQSSSLQQDYFNCCVSVGITSQLVFEVGVGPVAVYKHELVEAQVEPMVELPADDLLSGKIALNGITAHQVEIKSCKFSSKQVPASSEKTGEVRITIRVAPVENAHANGKEWNTTGPECFRHEAFQLREARM